MTITSFSKTLMVPVEDVPEVTKFLYEINLLVTFALWTGDFGIGGHKGYVSTHPDFPSALALSVLCSGESS